MFYKTFEIINIERAEKIISIPYYDTYNEMNRTFLPDFIITFNDNKRLLVEVKYLMVPNNKIKWIDLYLREAELKKIALIKYCAENIEYIPFWFTNKTTSEEVSKCFDI